MLGFSAALLLVGVRHLPRAVATAVAGTGLVAVLLAPGAYAVSTAATPHAGALPTAGPSAGPTAGPTAGPSAGRGPGGAGGRGGRAGGLLDGSEPTAALTALLEVDAQRYTWVAAAVGANSAAGYQLASQRPVLAIGGFNGSDPSPTLAEFQRYVAAGEIHYFLGSGGGPGGFGGGFGRTGGSRSSSAIASWVAATFTARTVGGVTVYDLTAGAR